MKHFSEKKGSALIASFLIAILVGSIAGLYLESARQEYKMAHRARMNMEAINVAEVGAEDALFAITTDDWTGWDRRSSWLFENDQQHASWVER
jgi:hypothetical protein|tara:strand:+ start:9702 stop:9980 length:279 start_codon:yes stop_codon:yes gene_type:complete